MGGAQLLAGILGGARIPPMIAAGIPIIVPQIAVQAFRQPPQKAKGEGDPQVGGAQGGGPHVGGAQGGGPQAGGAGAQ
jgi:hypothetical protein